MLQTKYISLDEFQEYFQIDLRAEFGTEEAALAFLKRIEDRLETFVDSNFNANVNMRWPNFTQYQNTITNTHYWNKPFMCLKMVILVSIPVTTQKKAKLHVLNVMLLHLTVKQNYVCVASGIETFLICHHSGVYSNGYRYLS